MAELARLHSPSEIEIVIATDEMAPEIERLAEANGFAFDGWIIDWSHVSGSWLVAMWEDEIVGCIQVLPAHPVGRLELQFIDPEQHHRVRAIAVKKLLTAGFAALRASGVQGVASTVPYELGDYREILRKHFGGIDLNEGWIMLARTKL